MEAVKVLEEEHRLILEFLDCFAAAARRVVDNRGPKKEFFEKGLDFCRTFADKHHHWKEEYVMFGLLAQKHNGAIDAEIERHRNQHEQCRDLIRSISESLDGYSRNLDSMTRRVHRNVSEYVDVLRKHIHSENDVFFPMVEEVLTEAEDEALLEEFRKYEAKTGPKVRETYRDLVMELAKMLDFSQGRTRN